MIFFLKKNNINEMEPTIHSVNSIPNLGLVRIITFHTDKDPNAVFSNFYSCNITYKDKSFRSSEHLYQWMKFQKKNDLYREYQEVIRNASTPYIAKMYGRQQTWYKQYKWSQQVQKRINHYLEL